MSWEQLAAAQRLAAEEQAEDATTPPVACPLCGEPFQTGGPDGVQFCPFDGYQPSGIGVYSL